MASASVEMVDVKRVIKELRQLDPELQKEFRRQAAELAKPAIEAARAEYRSVPLSGLADPWREKRSGRRIAGFSVSRAQTGVRFRLDYRRNAVGVLNIEQRDQPTAIFETAGRRNPNRLAASLDQVAAERMWKRVPDKPTRLFGPAVYRAARKGVTDALRRLILDAARTVEKRI